MKNKGLVIENSGDRSKILVYRTEACGSCESCGACDAKPTEYWVKNTLGAIPGQMVTVEMANAQFFGSLIKLYLMPLAMFLIGMAVFYSAFSGDELMSILGGLVGLSGYMIIGRALDRRMSTERLVEMVGVDPLIGQSGA